MVVVIVGRGWGSRVVSPAANEALVSVVRRVGLVEVVEHLLAEGGDGGREALPLRSRGFQFALQSES